MTKLGDFMSKFLKFFLAFLTVFSSSLYADDQPLDLDGVIIFSVIYTTGGRALVGVVNNQNIASYAICRAPRDNSRLKDLFSCEGLPDSTLVYSKDTALRINQLFPNILSEIVSKRRYEEISNQIGQNELQLALLEVVYAGAAITTTALAIKGFKSRQYATGSFGTVGAVISLVFLLFNSLEFSIQEMFASDAGLPSLESRMAKSLRNSLSRSSDPEKAKLTAKGYSFSFDIICEAILTAIRQATTI
jgi:hypothetical protein